MENSVLNEKKNGYLKVTNEVIENANSFCKEYKNFLNIAKTERECVKYIKEKIEPNGFRKFNKLHSYKPGDKLYYINKNKSITMVTIGSEPLDTGITFVISHIDSPRIDLTPSPLYEDSELSFFSTQYYGGIKKYQWTTIPLAIHGVISKKDGTIIDIQFGENEEDPIFYISDLLPHIAENQMKRTAAQLIKGEELNILIGSIPVKDDKAKQAVKLNIMKILNEKYGIVEQDLVSADLSFVPAYKARDVGFDSSLLAAYGQDDRVCVYTSLEAHLDLKIPKQTTITVFTDKEETGSSGNTGLKSKYLEFFVSDLADCFGVNSRVVFSNSVCLSADVSAALDPTWKEPYDMYNSCHLNYGVCLTKYTGGRGKSDTSEASAEFMGEVIRILDQGDIMWQTGGLGKVDVGGGGTIAKYIANLNIDVLDIGVPVLSMHSPYEITSKLDIYMTYKAFSTFISR